MDTAQASSWPLEGTERTEFGLIPRPELPPVLLPAWAAQGTIGIMVLDVTRATKEEKPRGSPALGSLWGGGGGEARV